MEPNFSNASPSNSFQTGPVQTSQAKDKISGGVQSFLLNLGIVISLLSIYPSFLSFVFDMLNSVFPDALDNSYYYSYSISWQDSSIRWAMSILVIGVPVYILLSWLANRQVREFAIYASQAGKKGNGGRKILGSIIIFLSAAVVITDLITLVYYFFGGEVTTRFALKSLITLLSAGGIFWYYLYDIKRDYTLPSSGAKIGAIAVIAVTLVSIILGFVVIGSPTNARYQKFDQTRISNLQSLASEMGSFWQNKGALPKNLDELTYFMGKLPVDPETGAGYSYSATDERHFSLCAVFDTESPKVPANTQPVYYGYNSLGITDWSHQAGQKCFQGYLDPSVYPPKADSSTQVQITNVPQVVKPLR